MPVMRSRRRLSRRARRSSRFCARRSSARTASSATSRPRARGGDWQEGANYGERAKERMFGAFAAAASMGGPNYFNQTRFAADCILYAVYQVQPGKLVMAPTGDLPRDSSAPMSPLDRDYIQIATFYTNDAVARGYGAWLLKEVVPSYRNAFVQLARGVLPGRPLRHPRQANAAHEPPARVPFSGNRLDQRPLRLGRSRDERDDPRDRARQPEPRALRHGIVRHLEGGMAGGRTR